MRTTDALKLYPDELILHTRYGKCKVVDEPIGTNAGDFFGIIIRPMTTNGKRKLYYDSGSCIDTLLEDKVRCLKHQEFEPEKKVNLNLIDAEHAKNFTIELFMDGNRNPRLPERALNSMGSIMQNTKGLFVEGGRIWFTGKLENVFQKFDQVKGWTGHDLTYCKLRYNDKRYVTFVILDEMESGYIVGVHDGGFGYSEEAGAFDENERRILKQVTELIYKNPLPHPIITYDLA